VQREVESYLEKKAQTIVAQIVGGKNARVQVSADINFDHVERTTQAVDPDKQAVATEQKAEITPGAQGGAASSNVATSYETTKSTESFSGAIGNVKRLTVAVLVNDRIVPGPKPTTLPRSGPELARIDTLVRAAVGIDTTRGDKLAVVNTTFDGAVPLVSEALEKPDIWSRIGALQRPIVAALAVLGVLVVSIMTLRALKPARGTALAAGDAPHALGAGQMSEIEAARLLEEQQQQIYIAGPEAGAPVVLHEIANPVRDQVVAIIDQRPEATTRVVRSRLKEQV
jgi:flagellar M-ring protein FliF